MSYSEELVQSLKSQLRKTSNTTSKCSLYSLSVKMSELQSDFPFRPCIVSIGIAAHIDQNVIHMQPQKWVYMNALLSRTHLVASSIDESKNAVLESCVNTVSEVQDEVMLYFGRAGEFFLFAEVLILDACFILELLVRYYSVFGSNLSDFDESPLFKPLEDPDIDQDPLLKYSWMMSAVRRDLALLENQIPFSLLQKLFDVVAGRDTSLPHDFLVQMVTVFFQPSHILDRPPVLVIERGLHRVHLLNLLLNIYRPMNETNVLAMTPRRPSTVRRTFLLNVTSLAQVGVRFKSQALNSSLLDIKFREGTFEIPTLHISNWTDSFFRNIIAFERCCPDRKPYMASYLELMRRLIVGTEDVQFLSRRGILINDLGSDEVIIEMFNRIGRQFDQPDYFYYQELCDLVDASYNTMWNLYKREVAYQYFRSPWAVISMLAAMLLLVCTIIQTIYAVLYYYQIKGNRRR